MPYIKLLKPVTYGNSIVEAGETIEVSERSANSLIEEGVAVHIEAQEPATVDVTNEDGVPGINTPTNDEEDAKSEIIDQEALEEKSETIDQEALAKVIRALNEKFKRDELASAAKEVGVEFAYDAKKGEIVDAVIAAGKAEVLLHA